MSFNLENAFVSLSSSSEDSESHELHAVPKNPHKTCKKSETKTLKPETPKSKTPKSKTPKSKTPKSKTPKSKTPKSKTPKSKTPKSNDVDIESGDELTTRNPWFWVYLILGITAGIGVWVGIGFHLHARATSVRYLNVHVLLLEHDSAYRISLSEKYNMSITGYEYNTNETQLFEVDNGPHDTHLVLVKLHPSSTVDLRNTAFWRSNSKLYDHSGASCSGFFRPKYCNARYMTTLFRYKR